MSDSGRAAVGRLLTFALPMIGCMAGFVGCAPSEPPQFTPSADVTALSSDAQTTDEKQEWSGLQREIADELSKRCGAPLAPTGLEGAGLSDEGLADGAAVFARRCQPYH